ncbi:reversion-inducing cysteine-rich protein with Kazal motifs isoform X1 [Nilaparvata lugens]|uniref:reversion-inducing cysteine-rich protein with Kazal motifs isoform X1 n=1 Tax=Nilaparvata lugens TaxID=108931 RepID=UPI00193DA438|nr:reversion-inducing cysteine-rich protein with Kazal motifs isoform X1 [Nilaparvata lugens]
MFELCARSVAVLWIIFAVRFCCARGLLRSPDLGIDSDCCTQTTGSCRSACEQLMLVTTHADAEVRDQRLLDVHNFCSPNLRKKMQASFWNCMNETLKELNRVEQWSGSVCCSLPHSEKCQQACVSAGSRHDLIPNCRQSDEISFFNCLDRQQVGEDCCGSARNAECQTACQTVFRSELTPNREARENLSVACSDSSPRVMSCINNFIRVSTVSNAHKYLHCCEKTTKVDCREACRTSLRTKSTDQEIIDSLQEGGCGPPLLHEALWQCFLQGGEAVPSSLESSRIERMGMDSAKMHCCFKAVQPSCRRLCLKTFSNEWTRSWEEFAKECLSQLTEDKLLQCLDEVEEPCELGCEGLSYCTNFNNRPTELFRSCSSQADEAARYDVALWQQKGFLSLPGLNLHVRNISRCSPHMWKAVACTLQIKPCHRHSHANRICRDDCFELLSHCVDWAKMPGYSAASLCARLSPDNPIIPCISLSPYLAPSDHPYHPPHDQLTQPCKGDPCNSSQICQVNRNCHHSNGCQPYQCFQGCKLGEVSQYTVPAGSYVRIPVPSGQKGCLKICQCSSLGTIDQCQPMPCFPLDSCWLGSKKIDHGSWFYMECNLCSCYAGEISCSKKQCEVSSLSVKDSAYTSLPCNCPPHHVPVCGRNGNTYPSSCLAKCVGLSDADFEFGACESKNPCASNPCNENEVCIPDRQVCLSLLHKPCQQYSCVNARNSCKDLPYDPVCDTSGHEHQNICFLLQHGKTLDYHGPCLYSCKRTGTVCGIDGNTYASECAALARRVTVDYVGTCMTVGLIGDHAEPQCRHVAVVCPPLARPDCVGITPPTACCPVCAGAVNLLYSQKQVDRALYALRGNSMSALTVEAVLSALERQIQVAECVVRGILTVQLDILVLITPTDKHASALQFEACVREAEKLSSLVRRSSPRMMSELSLSALTAAAVVHSVTYNTASVLLSLDLLSLSHLLAPSLFLLLRWSHYPP